MKSLRAPVLVVGLIVGVLAGEARAQSSARALANESWTVDGVQRTGLVAAPPENAPASGAPLVLVFHGHGGTSRNISRTLGIHAQWPEAAVLYLQGLPAPSRIATVDPEGRLPGWQNAPGALGDRDLKLVDTVLAWAKQKYRIDAKRVYAAGHSNGALFCYLLWATRADTFAAFAPAAAAFTQLIASAKPRSALILAGDQDALVPFATQQRNITNILRLNQCDTIGAPWDSGALIHSSRVGADTVVAVYHGGHPLPPDAASLVAKFFKAR
jgi:polyhydroxybutyrate depolymerase